MGYFTFANIIASIFILITFKYLYSFIKYLNKKQKYSHFPGLVTQFWDFLDPFVLLGLIPVSLTPVLRKHLWDYRWKDYERAQAPAFGLVTSTRATLYIADPEIVKQVLTTQRSDFPKPDIRGQLFGQNLVSTEGETWRRHRKIAAPTFTEKTYRLVNEATVRIVELMFQFWDTKMEEVNDGTTKAKQIAITPHLEMLQIALSVLSHAAFGQQLDWLDPQKKETFFKQHKSSDLTFQQALHDLITNLLLGASLPKWFVAIFPFGAVKTFRIAYHSFENQMRALVKEKLESLKDIEETNVRTSDLLTNLVMAKKAAEKENNRNHYLSESELYGNLFVFILAGHETTAGTLHFALTLLACYPETQDKLYKEVTKLLGDRQPTYDDYSQLLYVQYIMKETLRLFPPATSASKRANKDTTLQIPLSQYQTNNNQASSNKDIKDEIITLKIPKGTNVVSNIAALHRNPNYWSKPDEFIPERFDPKSGYVNYDHKKNKKIGEDGENKDGNGDEELSGSESDIPYHRYAWIPFSEGIRICIGRKFSEIEFATALTLIIQRYSLHLPSDVSKETALQADTVVTLRPKNPTKLLFRKRI